MATPLLTLLLGSSALIFGLTTSKEANLFLIRNSGEAVCLDGSPPGYYFRPGRGKNASKAIVFLEGGGTCNNGQECLERSKTRLGSSNYWPPTAEFDGILSDDKEENPNFYDWNITFVNYCDGAFYSGYVSHPVTIEGSLIYFRGYKILQTVFQTLLNKGLDKATDVILTGCSAGGVATYIHADYMQSILSPSTKYRAMADGGYFISVLSVDGKEIALERAAYIEAMQNVSTPLINKCINYYGNASSTKCKALEVLYSFIETPIFSFNSQYDTWQLDNNLLLPCYPPATNCTTDQVEELEEFHEEFMKAAQSILNSTHNGAFLDSCFAHCQSLNSNGWTSVKIGGQSAAETFANWYFERNTGSSKEIDCSYPCNPTC